MRPEIPAEQHALEIAARLITARTDPEGVLQAVLDACLEATKATRALLGLVDRRNGELVIQVVAGEGWTEAKKKERLRAGSGVHQGIIGLVATTGQPYSTGDVSQDQYYYPLFDDVMSELAVPLIRSGDRLRGVLNIESGEPDAFTDEDQRLVTVLAALASVAVSRAEHYRRERRLAEELRVSRTPIREALFTLRGEGLVDLTPNQCARVSHVTQSDIKQIYALRRLLESHSARLAAENGDRVKIDRVADALAAQQRLGKAGTAQDQAQADLAFHEAVAAAAGSQLLLTVERQVLAVTITHRSRYKYSNPQLKRGWRQHGEVLKAIEAGDGGSAETLMAEHIAESSEIAFKHFGADRPRGCRESVGSPKRPEVRG